MANNPRQPRVTEPIPKPPRDELERLYVREVKGMKWLAEHYGVGIGTIHKWIHDYDIPTRVMAYSHPTQVRSGAKMRLCKGPLHAQGEWLPIEKFHRYRKRRRPVIRSVCKRCDDALGKFPQPNVPFTAQYKSWLKSIRNRLGVMETCRRLGIHDATLRKWLGYNPPSSLRRQNAATILALMQELRQTGEVRHRDSIHRGATKRGEAEKRVTANSHLYKPHGEEDNERRRRSYRRLTAA